MEFRKIGGDQTPNIAIVAMSAKRNYERPTEVQIFARLANYAGGIVVMKHGTATVSAEELVAAVRGSARS